MSHISVKFEDTLQPRISLFLPMHKADHFFEGSTVVFEKRSSILDPVHFFKIYLQSRNQCYPHLPELWLCSDGRVPTRSWFINQIRLLFPSNNITGHSLHSGESTALALTGTPLHCIHSARRCSYDASLNSLRKKSLITQMC